MEPTQGQDNDDLEVLDSDPQGDADFEAAFNKTRANAGVEVTTQPKAKELEPEPESTGPADDPADAEAAARAQAEADAAAAAAKQAEEANAPVTLTRAEMQAIQSQLAKFGQLEQQLQHTAQQSQKAFGKLGSLQNAVDAIKEQASRGRAPTIKQLARLEQEFPELATLLKDDLADAFGRAEEAQPAGDAKVDQQATNDDGNAGDKPAPEASTPADPLADERVQKLLREKEMSIVDLAHPGWRGSKQANGTYAPGLIDSPDFGQWQATLPEQARTLLANTWDSTILRDAFADFKAWRDKRATQAQAQAEANKNRDKRVERAVPATSGGSAGVNAVDEDAEFEAAFNRVRKGLG